VTIEPPNTPTTNELVRPIDAETARAVESLAKFGTRFLDSADKAGGYATGIFGRLPHNLVGFVDDWVFHQRVRRWAGLQADTLRILEDRAVPKPYVEISPSIAVPLLEAAVDETREHLKQLWAKLLAAALDPTRAGFVRPSIVAIVKGMDPIDVLVMQEVDKQPSGSWSPSGRDFMASALKVTQDEILVSFDNLTRLGCVTWSPTGPHINPIMAPLGKLLMMAVRN
jgi:Abortive infection alpha